MGQTSHPAIGARFGGWRRLLMVGIVVFANSVNAISDAAWLQQAEAIASNAQPRYGELRVSTGQAVIDVPPGYYYLDRFDAERVLVDIWGNPPQTGALALILPNYANLLSNDAWGIVVQYLADGYVPIDNFDDIDFAPLLESTRIATRKAMVERLQRGYRALELVGWASPPSLDRSIPAVFWAKVLEDPDDRSRTVNLNARLLGRQGVVVLNAVAPMEAFVEVDAAIEAVVDGFEFTRGFDYDAFDAKSDRRARYKVQALITEVFAEGHGGRNSTLWLYVLLGLIGGALVAGLTLRHRRSN